MEQPVFILHRIDTVINITRLVTIHYFEFAKDFVFDGERHDIWEMVYVDKGEILETAGTETIVLRQGELLFHKPGEFHSLRANGKDCSNVFVITFVSSSRMMSFFEHKHCRLKAELRRLIASIIEEGQLAFELPFFDVHMKELKEKKEAPVMMTSSGICLRLLRPIKADPRIPQMKRNRGDRPIRIQGIPILLFSRPFWRRLQR